MKKLDLSCQAATTKRMRDKAGITCQMTYFERETITISLKLLTKSILETSSKFKEFFFFKNATINFLSFD